MGSSRVKRPSSYSIRAATLVSGFVIDASRKIVSPLDGQIRRQIPTPHDRCLDDVTVSPHEGRGTGEVASVYLGLNCSFD